MDHVQSGSYVVHQVGRDNPKSFKHYGVRADAMRNGQDKVQSGSVERTFVQLPIRTMPSPPFPETAPYR